MKIAQILKISGNQLEGPLPTLQGSTTGTTKFPTLASVINQAMPLLFSIAGILLFLYLVWGGFNFLTSMGDPKKAEMGKHKITSAVIGIVILFAAYWVVQLTDIFFGFGIY